MDKIKRETEEAVQTEKKRADAATQAANHKQIEKDREAAELKARQAALEQQKKIDAEKAKIAEQERIEKEKKEKAEREAKEK